MLHIKEKIYFWPTENLLLQKTQQIYIELESVCLFIKHFGQFAYAFI